MSLPYRERLRLAWELTWPLALIDLVFVLLIHGVFDTKGETADSVWAVASFFAISPWIIRRGLRLSYGSAKFEVVRRTNREAVLSYQESLKVMWLLAWRTLALSLVALLAVSLLFAAMRSNFRVNTESALWNNLGLSAIDAVSSLVFTPFLIPGMLRKRYRGFHLELVVKPVPAARNRGRTKL
jgi:hypothetical protein